MTQPSLFSGTDISPDIRYHELDDREYRVQVVTQGGVVQLLVEVRVGQSWTEVRARIVRRAVIERTGIAEWEGGRRGRWRLENGYYVGEAP